MSMHVVNDLVKLQALKDLYTHLTPIQRLNIARHPNRPTVLDHIFNITDKVHLLTFCLIIKVFLFKKTGVLLILFFEKVGGTPWRSCRL